jgi:glycosyltransferase involved in cell wall biosynthesis
VSREPGALHICHVSPHLPPDQAANALLPAQLARWGAAAGSTRASFVTHEPAQGNGPPTSLPGPVRRVPRGRRSRAARLLRLDRWREIRAIARALDEVAGDADLLHLHSNGLIVEVAAAWARRKRRPYVLTLYGTEIWHYRRRRPVDPFTWAYRRAAEVTFYSRRLEQHARDVGLERTAMRVVYPAVSDDFAEVDAATRVSWRTALGIAEPFLILNVKRLHELAGQRFLIDAFASVARSRRDVRLVICGTGPLRQELELQAVAAGVGAQVTFTGLIPNHEVARYAAVTDVFVLPSLLEALPTVAVEALASGTPVVSADHPGGVELHEIFGDDVTVVPKGEAAALAGAMEAALAHPRRTRPATADLVRQQFSPAAVQQAYMTVYARVLESPVV